MTLQEPVATSIKTAAYHSPNVPINPDRPLDNLLENSCCLQETAVTSMPAGTVGQGRSVTMAKADVLQDKAGAKSTLAYHKISTVLEGTSDQVKRKVAVEFLKQRTKERLAVKQMEDGIEEKRKEWEKNSDELSNEFDKNRNFT